jgi:hypothetical protein
MTRHKDRVVCRHLLLVASVTQDSSCKSATTAAADGGKSIDQASKARSKLGRVLEILNQINYMKLINQIMPGSKSSIK